MKKIDMIGRKFNRALVEKEIEPHLDPSGRKRRQFQCLCDCGERFTAIGEMLRSGAVQSCGCYRSELLSKKREIDLTGETIGRWFIESEAFRDRRGIHWNAICMCGNKGLPTTNNLLNGTSKSCGCYNKECISARERKDITGQKFYKLTAKECIGKNEYNNYLWRCICDCGREIVTTASRLLGGQIISCGCTKSKGECLIEDYFIKNNIKYDKYKYFDDLKYKTYLYFDFCITNHKNEMFLLEYQGEQHYYDCGYFGKQQREITDPMKRKYCSTNNIKLFEIRFDDDIKKKLDDIVAYVNPVLNSEISEEV